jgi:hypothetical protein
LGEEYKSWSSSIQRFLHSLVTSAVNYKEFQSYLAHSHRSVVGCHLEQFCTVTTSISHYLPKGCIF